MLYEAYQAHDDLMSPVRGFAGIAARCLASLPPALADQVGVRSLAAGLRDARPGPRSPTSARPSGSRRCRSAGRLVDGRGAGGRRHAVLHAHALRQGHPRPRARGARSWRRCRVTSPRCCATPCTRCCATTTCTSPTGTTPATSRSQHGRFGLDEYVEHVIRFLDVLGPGAHVMAVCQPCVPVLAATAVMAEDRDPAPAREHDPDGRADRRPRQPRRR